MKYIFFQKHLSEAKMASMNATVSASDLNAYKDAYINKAESDMNLNALNIKKSQEHALLYRMVKYHCHTSK